MFIYKDLGIEYNKHYKSACIREYGGKINEMLRDLKFIEDSKLEKVILEIVPELKAEDILSMLNNRDKQSIRSKLKANLIESINQNLKSLTSNYAKEYADKVFQEYIKEGELK